MSTILMGFDVSHVQAADVMELAAKLLEVDAGTMGKLYALVGVEPPRKGHNFAIAALLRERAAEVRALEMLVEKTELDS